MIFVFFGWEILCSPTKACEKSIGIVDLIITFTTANIRLNDSILHPYIIHIYIVSNCSINYITAETRRLNDVSLRCQVKPIQVTASVWELRQQIFKQFPTHCNVEGCFLDFFRLLTFPTKKWGRNPSVKCLLMTSRLGKISKIISWYKTYEWMNVSELIHDLIKIFEFFDEMIEIKGYIFWNFLFRRKGLCQKSFSSRFRDVVHVRCPP